MEFVPARHGLVVAAIVVLSALIMVVVASLALAVWLISSDVKRGAGETLCALAPVAVLPAGRIPGAGLPARVFFLSAGGGAA